MEGRKGYLNIGKVSCSVHKQLVHILAIIYPGSLKENGPGKYCH